MIRVMISAPNSGSGKTAIVCGLLNLLHRHGYHPCALKCGPDYIDPMFHRSVLSVESHNLDSYLSSSDQMRALFAHSSSGHDAVVCEGAMGFYDGVGGVTTQASAWEAADILDFPVVLVVRPKGNSLTLAAQIQGLCRFRQPSHIAGVILNDCSEMLYRTLSPMLERETGLAVLGFLPHMADAQFESRHLGLYTAQEITDLDWKIQQIADQMEQTVDVPHLLSLCHSSGIEHKMPKSLPKPTIRIALANDEAFCFTYEENKEELRARGAELVEFSPIHDNRLPDPVHALYLPGGYPELYAKQLSENRSMRESIRMACGNGLPTIAECGGFLYLGDSLVDSEGNSYDMAGFLNGRGIPRGRLVRFGYAELTAKSDSMLFRSGEKIRTHEFHYWDSTENGDALDAVKLQTGRSWSCGIATETLYAGFPHLYFTGNPALAARFVEAARRYKEGKHEA